MKGKHIENQRELQELRCPAKNVTRLRVNVKRLLLVGPAKLKSVLDTRKDKRHSLHEGYNIPEPHEH